METYPSAPARPDITLWYGPFEARWGRSAVPLVVSAFLLFVALLEERGSFRSLECVRPVVGQSSPGRCTVERGSVLLGVDRDRARAETFDPYVVVEVLPQRRAERRSRKALVLVDRQGHETVIVEGAAVPALFPEAQRFFGPRGAEALSLRAPWSVEGWMIKGALAVVAFVVSAWFARASLRASARVRIEVLHSEGIVRIEAFRGARRHVEIALADVASVDVVWSDIVRSDLARVSLMCREGPDVPLLTHPLFGKTVHSSLAAELRHALGVRGEPAS